jgi:hypothetical protein
MDTQRVLLVLACLAATGWNGQAFSRPPTGGPAAQKSPDRKFEELLAKAQKEPAKADWKRLRSAFAATTHYHPYNSEWTKELAKVGKELHEGEPKKAEAMLVKLLERERFMRLDGHAMAIAVYEKLGDSENARKHRAFLEGISTALFIPGTGKSFDKPIEVLFVDEEYLFLGSLGLKMKQQGLSEHNGHKFDVLTTEAKGDQPALDFYFNIDLPWGAMEKSFGSVLDAVKRQGGKQ